MPCWTPPSRASTGRRSPDQVRRPWASLVAATESASGRSEFGMHGGLRWGRFDPMSVAGSDASSRPHIAARLDDQLTGLTNTLFRRRGWQPRVVPYLSLIHIS